MEGRKAGDEGDTYLLAFPDSRPNHCWTKKTVETRGGQTAEKIERENSRKE